MSNSFDIQDLLQQSAQSIEPRPEFSGELWREIRTTPVTNGHRAAFRLRLSPGLAGFIIILVLLTAGFIIGPQNIVQAFENLVGYLPGIGFVEEGDGTLYLAEPVSLTQEGATLTVDQAVSDSNNLIISLRIENLPPKEGGGFDCMYTDNHVQLPDGKSLRVMGGESTGKDTTFTSRLEFLPLSQGMTDFQLQIALSDPIESCSAPAQWQVDLSLSEKPGDVTLMPVYEAPTATAPDISHSESMADNQSTESTNDAEGAAQEQFKLIYERTVLLPDGYRISGRLNFPQDQYENASCNFESIQVKDAIGDIVAIEPPGEGTRDNEWAIILPYKEYQYPLAIECRRISVFKMLMNDGPAFSFDAGSQPAVGQSWDINQTLEAEGQEIEIKTVEVIGERQLDSIPPDDGSDGRTSKPGGYRIEYRQADSIEFLSFSPTLPTSSGLSGLAGSGGVAENGLHYMELDFLDGLSPGNVSFQLTDLNYLIDGTWQVSWKPPETEE